MLHDRRILITESASSQLGTADLVRQRGGIPVTFPLISIKPPLDPAPLQRALLTLHEYDWVLFTSSNGVRSFFRAAVDLNLSPEAIDTVRYGAVGPGTARTISEFGRAVAFVPADYNGGAMGRTIAFRPGGRFLLPRGDIAGPDLYSRLCARGARVETVEAYRTVANVPEEDRWLDLKMGIDAILFSSPSAVASFSAYVPAAATIARQVPIGCIGRTTADAVRKSAMPVAFMSEGTGESLCDALVDYFQSVSTIDLVQ
jgi:uroporphyrinogen-III synthase